jgi:hypothetical protein
VHNTGNHTESLPHAHVISKDATADTHGVSTPCTGNDMFIA